MAKIHRLGDRLISQIAAGEVVERPASVVKELVENALDAGASRIEVELAAGGKSRIRVRDDGSGMSADDSLLAFDRHATSKIESFEDLTRVATLGFRGEALSSIGAVSRVELLSAEAAGSGQRVRVEGGLVTLAEPAAFPRGTQIDVRSLFFNVPARRKFLKRPQTELRRCLEVIQGYALASPDVSLRAVHEGRELVNAFAAGSGPEGRKERIAQIFGVDLASRLVEIPGVSGASGDSTGISIGGFLGDRTTSRGRRLFVFTNGRLIRDRSIMAVFYRAVREQWQSEEFPSLFLFLELPPEDVDVNVHPQKSEVRFRDTSLLGRLGNRLREALAKARGEGDAPLRPARDFLPPLGWQGVGGRRPISGDGGPSLLTDQGGGLDRGDLGDQVGEPVRHGYDRRLAEVSYQPGRASSVPLSSGGTGAMRLLGQYKGSLILLEGPEALYLVDQHAAHERILYESFRRDLAARRVVSQNLLTPLLLELSASEAHTLGSIAEPLENSGFSIRGLSGSTIAVAAIPTALSMGDAERILLEVAAQGSEVDSWAGQQSVLRQGLLDALAASLACRSAVKIHRPLTHLEMERVVSELFDAEEPFACPHGRPTILKMEDGELERRFGRRG